VNIGNWEDVAGFGNKGTGPVITTTHARNSVELEEPYIPLELGTFHSGDESFQAIDCTGTDYHNQETKLHMHLKHKVATVT